MLQPAACLGLYQVHKSSADKIHGSSSIRTSSVKAPGLGSISEHWTCGTLSWKAPLHMQEGQMSRVPPTGYPRVVVSALNENLHLQCIWSAFLG